MIEHFSEYNPEDGTYTNVPFHTYVKNREYMKIMVYSLNVLDSKEGRTSKDMIQPFPDVYDLLIKFIIDKNL